MIMTYDEHLKAEKAIKNLYAEAEKAEQRYEAALAGYQAIKDQIAATKVTEKTIKHRARAAAKGYLEEVSRIEAERANTVKLIAEYDAYKAKQQPAIDELNLLIEDVVRNKETHRALEQQFRTQGDDDGASRHAIRVNLLEGKERWYRSKIKEIIEDIKEQKTCTYLRIKGIRYDTMHLLRARYEAEIGQLVGVNYLQKALIRSFSEASALCDKRYNALRKAKANYRERSKDLRRREQETKKEIYDILGIPEEYRELAKPCYRKDGKVQVYFGGDYAPDGYKHGHAVYDIVTGKVRYYRGKGEEHGRHNFWYI